MMNDNKLYVMFRPNRMVKQLVGEPQMVVPFDQRPPRAAEAVTDP